MDKTVHCYACCGTGWQLNKAKVQVPCPLCKGKGRRERYDGKEENNLNVETK